MQVDYRRPDLSIDQQLALRTAATNLARAFDGTFGTETIDRFLHSSYDEFAGRAVVLNFLPLLAERFARQRLRALAKVEGRHDDGVPVVLFLCTHNAGRSQMAMGFFQHLAGDRAIAWSGGSEPAIQINPAAIAAMAERGIDISGEYPKPWTDEIVRAADVVVTMGCGDACPVFPGRRYEDWVLDDPAGLDVDAGPARSATRSNAASAACSPSSRCPHVPDTPPGSWADRRSGARQRAGRRAAPGRPTSRRRRRGSPPRPRWKEHLMNPIPQVLFVCVHNAGRSQMAAAFLHHYAEGAVEVRSAGSAPADTINPAVREAMAEVGIDLSGQQPKLLTTDAVEASDVVITMGCGDACPVFPGKRYLDWQLADPAGKGVEAVRPIRDEIDRRVRGLLAELTADAPAGQGPR